MKVNNIYLALNKTFEYYLNVDVNEPSYDDYDLLVEIVEIFRPKKQLVDIPVNLEPLINLLQDDVVKRQFFINYLKQLFYNKDFSHIITDAGILDYMSFWSEIKKRAVQKLIPNQPDQNSLEFILNQVFYSRLDPQWLKRLNREQIVTLYDLCQFQSIYFDDRLSFEFNKLLFGIEVLAQRISGKAMESDVSKMAPEYANFDSPFIGLLREVGVLIEKIKLAPLKIIGAKDITYKQVLILHAQCVQFVDTAFSNAQKFGISFKVNQGLLRLRQQLERIKELLALSVAENDEDEKQQTLNLAISLIRYNCNKNNIRSLLNDSTQIIAYEVTQHTADTGEKYITSSKADYYKMLKASCIGGVIVGFLCIIKILLSKVDTSQFGHAVLYSLNYSLGFILIYLVGGTLATKQPAMTAATLVRALKSPTTTKEEAEYKYWNFASFFARVFRSQFIAFVGNVFASFPVALGLIWLIDLAFKYNIASSKWFTLLNDLDPIESPAIFHSAIAGCFLFISGIIAGSIANRDKHEKIYYRIQQHPFLKRVFGKQKTLKIASLYEKKWAGIISNFWFGVFMGCTSSIGVFLGLNLDIRHITFASGNLALGLYGHDFLVPTELVLWSILGIGIIGLVNFMVSFTLSLLLAFRSRKMSLVELWLVGVAVWEYFKLKPATFFFPPKTEKQSETTVENTK